MRWRGGNRYGNIEDRRGMGRVGIAGGGIGAAVLGLLGYFVFGINPLTIMQMADQFQTVDQRPGEVGTPEDATGQFVDTILSSTTDVWRAQFSAMGRTYEPTNPLVVYEQATGTACGMGQAVMGPFYCPADQRIYMDLIFFRELSDRFGAPGEFAQAYVIAHEVAHHVQHLLGTAGRVRQLQQAARSEAEANAYSVALELQADCYAGVWASRVGDVSGGTVALESGDFESGLKAAEAIGDDTLQKATRGRVMPDSFTHGSSAQRMSWLKRGYDSGNPAACDTFNASR